VARSLAASPTRIEEPSVLTRTRNSQSLPAWRRRAPIRNYVLYPEVWPELPAQRSRLGRVAREARRWPAVGSGGARPGTLMQHRHADEGRYRTYLPLAQQTPDTAVIEQPASGLAAPGRPAARPGNGRPPGLQARYPGRPAVPTQRDVVEVPPLNV
jgi:hypothetical protein